MRKQERDADRTHSAFGGPAPRRPWRRFVFTPLMLLGLLIGAIVTHTLTGDLSAAWLDRLGFAPDDLWALRWGRIVSSALVTGGRPPSGKRCYSSCIAVGGAEWLAGSWMAAATFWGVHVLTLVLQSAVVALPLQRLGLPGSTDLATARDVGPSAGYFGCLGFVCARQRPLWRWISGAVVLLALCVVLVLPPAAGQDRTLKLSADMAHLIAFPLGFVLGIQPAQRSVPAAGRGHR